MKIIITEEMLKELVKTELNEWQDYGYIKPQQAQSVPSGAVSRLSDTFLNALRDRLGNLGNYGNGNVQGQGGQMFQGEMNLGNWNVTKSINWIMLHTSSRSQHRCAEFVENAIAAGGLPRMTCRENGGDGYAHSLHHCGTIRKYGFVMVDSGRLAPNSKYTGNLQPGDIIILDTYIPKKNHIAMWTGSQWISDFKQVNANVYSAPAAFWIYRYAGNQQKKETKE